MGESWVDVDGTRRTRRRRGHYAARPLAARRPGGHPGEVRLRRRHLRRVHGAPGRRSRAELPRPPREGRGSQGRHHRGRPGDRAWRPGRPGVRRPLRAAVRILHARIRRHRHVPPRPRPAARPCSSSAPSSPAISAAAPSTGRSSSRPPTRSVTLPETLMAPAERVDWRAKIAGRALYAADAVPRPHLFAGVVAAPNLRRPRPPSTLRLPGACQACSQCSCSPISLPGIATPGGARARTGVEGDGHARHPGRYVGEPVAAVVATSRAELRAALAAVCVSCAADRGPAPPGRLRWPTARNWTSSRRRDELEHVYADRYEIGPSPFGVYRADRGCRCLGRDQWGLPHLVMRPVPGPGAR